MFILLQLRDQLAHSRIYSLDLPSTPKSLDSPTPTSDDLPPYDTPPPSATDSSKEDCYIGMPDCLPLILNLAVNAEVVSHVC